MCAASCKWVFICFLVDLFKAFLFVVLLAWKMWGFNQISFTEIWLYVTWKGIFLHHKTLNPDETVTYFFLIVKDTRLEEESVVCFIFSSQMRRTELSSMKLPSVLPLPALHILNNFLADQVKSEICFRKDYLIVQLNVYIHSSTWVNNFSV